MTHKIKVQMFGNFRMDYNGAPFVAEKMHKESQFNRMMQALIHYSDCGIAKDKLEEIVIGERDIDAPHTALRVIVYKTKQKLAQLGLPGKNLIYLEGGIYYWTPDIEIEEDAAEFEKLYNEACALEKQMPQEPESAETVCDERIKEIEDNMLELYVKALYLYKGEFLAAYTGETWIAQEARRYHTMFEKIINEAAYILRKRKQFKGLEKIGVYAAKVDPFNEWEELIMEAMVETRRYDEAEELYTDVVDYYLRECGIYPSSRLLEILEKSDICFVDHAVTRCFHFAGNYNRFPFLAEYHGKTPIYQYDANKPDRENDDSFCWRGYFEQEKLMHELSKGGFGLVWSDDEYFDRYYSMNQPYKLGTNLAAGIIKHRTLGYRPEMVAMIIALVLVLIEAASVYFVVTMSGFFIGTGLIVILFVNIIVTIKRISEIEYKRQKEESDRLRNQTERVSLQMMKTLAATIEAKDDYMRGHSYRVAEYSALIAKQLGWSEHEVENLRNAAYLHDIGKIGVPDTILNKPTRLTDEEFAAIKSHTVMGADILKDITLLDHLVDIARNHHERYDGKGYPDGLVGEEIPLSARIVCVADSYDAMKSRRIYRNALPDEEIRRELLDNCGTQFDPQISRMFVDMLDNGMVVIDEDNPAAQGYRDNAAIESVADKFISEVMKTMSSQEKADSVDYLTGLYMRSRGQQVIAALMQDNDGCLAFIDMDNLKKVNDVHGHKAGDRALKLIGNLLAKETENETFAACRLGGDEFLIFMPYSDRASVESVIKRIFEGFESAREADCEIKEAALSAGLCMTTKGAMFESDYTKADKALYYVKQNCKGSYFFYEQLLADNKENTNLSADLRNVAKLLKESGSYTGALDLNYREFARIYEFVNNVGDRHNHNCYLVMVTMNTLPEQLADIEEIEKALDCMEQSIRSKIRKVDVCTRYSSMQYLIILFEPQENQIPNVMERIFMHYYELCDRENFKPQYEYIKMTEVK